MAWTSLLPDLTSTDAKNLVDLASARYPVSSDYEKLREICPKLVVGYDVDEWVFFGGSFHPWHSGHQACLNLLPEDKTCFVLPDRNPLKEVREVDPVLSTIELTSKIKFKSNQFLVPTFLLNEKKNPTIEWIEILHKNYPAKKLSLLMGFDSLLNLPTWIRASELLNLLTTLYVASRLEKEDEQQTAATIIKKLNPALNIVFLGHHQHEDLSSTKLRKK